MKCFAYTTGFPYYIVLLKQEILPIISLIFNTVSILYSSSQTENSEPEILELSLFPYYIVLLKHKCPVGYYLENGVSILYSSSQTEPFV